MKRGKDGEGERDRPGPYWVLRPHSLAAAWRHRDCCVRRRLAEIYACRVIQHVYRLHSVWRRISLKVYARRVAWWYKGILEERKRCRKIRLSFLDRSAAKIQRLCKGAMRSVRHASLQIQRMARGRLGRLRAKRFRRQVCKHAVRHVLIINQSRPHKSKSALSMLISSLRQLS